MMRKCLTTVLLLFWPTLALAQFSATIFNGPAAATYTGLCDAVPGCIVYYGLRGATAAYSTGTHPSICVNGTTPNQCDGVSHGKILNILSNGDLDVASATSTDATGSCTISGTTATCTLVSSSVLSYSNISGAGLTYPAYTTTSCSSSSCSFTLNASQTVSVAETITFYNQVNIDSWYDQIGTACSSAACNFGPVSWATNVSFLIFNCQNGHPCYLDLGANWQGLFGNATLNPSVSLPITGAFLGERLGSFTSYGVMMALCGSSCSGSTLSQWYWNNTANTMQADAAGTAYSATATDSSPHVVLSVLNGASSVVNVDGTETTGTVGAPGAQTKLYLLSNNSGTAPPNAYVMEPGVFWGSALSQANRSAACHNMATYWGTTTGTHC